MLARLFKRKRMTPHQLLSEALGDFELPAFQPQTMQTLRLLRDPHATWAQVGRAIESNPALVVRTLRVVNSAAFGLRQKVSNVTHAVGLLGRSKMESLVLGFVVAGKLPSDAAGKAGLDSPRFWRAASRRAAVGRSLADLIEPEVASEAFVGGLLQDMAVPLLAVAQAKRYKPVLEAWQAEQSLQLDLMEAEMFGWSHADVGASIAMEWDFPEALSVAIDNHHAPVEGDARPSATQLVALLDGEGDPEDGLDHVVETVRMSYDIAPDRVVQSVHQGMASADELARLLVRR